MIRLLNQHGRIVFKAILISGLLSLILIVYEVHRLLTVL